jgi:hypothetical protein
MQKQGYETVLAVPHLFKWIKYRNSSCPKTFTRLDANVNFAELTRVLGERTDSSQIDDFLRTSMRSPTNSTRDLLTVVDLNATGLSSSGRQGIDLGSHYGEFVRSNRQTWASLAAELAKDEAPRIRSSWYEAAAYGSSSRACQRHIIGGLLWVTFQISRRVG